MANVELEDLYKLVPYPSDITPKNLSQSEPSVKNRLGAARETVQMHLPLWRKHVWSNIIGGTLGSAVGYSLAQVHPPQVKGPLAAEVFLGVMFYSLPVISTFGMPDRPEDKFTNQLYKADPGDMIAITKPGSVKEAWRSGKSQPPQTILYIKPQE